MVGEERPVFCWYFLNWLHFRWVGQDST